jgi:uncharacterized iron-regulated protein
MKTAVRQLIATLLVWFAVAPAIRAQQSQENHYKIYDSAAKKTISADELVGRLGRADVLIFGEEHNDSIGHYLENLLFQKIVTRFGPNVALSMEMFENDVQYVLDEYLQGLIREKNLLKEARAWNNYKDYRPMVEFAKAKNLPVIAANAPARYVNLVTREGLPALQKVGPQGRQFLPPLPVDTATGRYYEKFEETMGGHGSMGGLKIYQSQNLWDASMSYRIARHLETHKEAKIFQVNGRFHSDEKLGTAARLQKLLPKLRILTLSSFSHESFADPDWQKFASLGDFVIVTDPAVKRSF